MDPYGNVMLGVVFDLLQEKKNMLDFEDFSVCFAPSFDTSHRLLPKSKMKRF